MYTRCPAVRVNPFEFRSTTPSVGSILHARTSKSRSRGTEPSRRPQSAPTLWPRYGCICSYVCVYYVCVLYVCVCVFRSIDM